jgi:hypothetical protein
MNVEYRILIKETRDIKGGTAIPATIPMGFEVDKSELFLGEIVNFKNLYFNKRLNNYGSCRFDIKVTDANANALISLREYSVWIYEKTSTGDVLVWSGEQVRRTGNLQEDHNDWATIYCYDWLYLFKDRYTAQSVTYTGVDAGLIAWGMINTSQAKTNGNLGIALGTIEETMDRTREYTNQNIMEAIINLSDVLYGFDFEITNNKVFNVYSVKGSDLSESIILEYGRNLQNCQIDEDFSNPCNSAIVLGEVIDGTELSRVERNDLVSQASYKLREMVLSADNVVDEDTLEEKGDALMAKYSTKLIKVDFEVCRGLISVTDFSLGDQIRLIIKNGCYNIDDEYRIFEWTVDHENDNTEKLSLVLGELGI